MTAALLSSMMHRWYVWTVVLVLTVVHSSLAIIHQVREANDDDYDYEFGNSTVTTPPPPVPILTAEAIANITVTGLVVIFITVLVIILFCTFERGAHKLRIRTSLERNKQIDRQIAAEKRRKELHCEEFRQKQAAEAAANVLQVRATLTDSGEVRYEEDTHTNTTVEASNPSYDTRSSGTTQEKSTFLTHEIETLGQNKLSSSEVVIDLEEAGDVHNNGATSETHLVDISLDSYTPFPTDHTVNAYEHPPVLLVQPAKES